MKLFTQKKKKSIHSGFTLIEVMVSILIFSAALIALTAIAGKGISATQDVSSETTAHYLAQEGLEVVRNIRDTNFKNQGTWDAGISMCTSSNPCYVQYGTGGGSAPTLLNGNGACLSNNSNHLVGCAVDQDTANGFYVDGNSGSPSGFYREVYLTQSTTNPAEYLVTSIVTWDQKSVPRSVTLQTILTNWE